MKVEQTIISLLCFCMFPALSKAQTTSKDTAGLKRELILEREYNPSIRDASKINEIPLIKEPEVPKATIDFSTFALPYEIKPQIPVLQAHPYMTQWLPSQKRGYLYAGISSFISVDGDLGYQILNTEKDRLSWWASHRSSYGKVKFLQTDEKQFMKMNDNWVGLDYAHESSAFRLFTGLKYIYSDYNYYGYHSLTAENISAIPLQTNHIVDCSVSAASQKEDELSYLLGLNYSYMYRKNAFLDPFISDDTRSSISGFEDKIKGPEENYFKINWDVHHLLQRNIQWGIMGYFNYNSYHLDSTNKGYYKDYKNYADLNLNPYLYFDEYKWDLRLGLQADVLFNHTRPLNIAPNIRFNYHPIERLTLYLNAEGGVNNNNQAQVYHRNRYVDPTFRLLDSYTGIDGTLGVKATIQDQFWLDVCFGYNYIMQKHYYISANPNMLSLSNGWNNRIRPMYGDENTFKIGLNFKYKYQNILDLGVKTIYYMTSVNSISEGNWGYDIEKPDAWNEPTVEADFHAGY